METGEQTPASVPRFQRLKYSVSMPLQGEACLPTQGQAKQAVITQCHSLVSGILKLVASIFYEEDGLVNITRKFWGAL